MSYDDDTTNLAAAIDKIGELTTAAGEAKEIGDAKFLVVPPGYDLKNITKLVEEAGIFPLRKRGTVALSSVSSLVTYCTDMKMAESSYIYADVDARTITAVFNDQKSSNPGWRDHRATYKAELTPEAKKWLSKNAVGMTQTEFAEFIEDNFEDIQGTDAQKLLDVATTIQAKTGISFSSAKRLQDGQTQLTYNETIDAKAGADGSLMIPKTFTLGLRFFKNGDGFKLTARLKYRLHGQAVKFHYELERAELAIDQAFEGYVEAVRDGTGYTVLLGTAG